MQVEFVDVSSIIGGINVHSQVLEDVAFRIREFAPPPQPAE